MIYDIVNIYHFAAMTTPAGIPTGIGNGSATTQGSMEVITGLHFPGLGRSGDGTVRSLIFLEGPAMSSRAVVSLVACVLFACISQGTARSAELKIFASRAIWTVLAEIGLEFEKNSGHKLNVISGLSSEFVGRINAGEAFDVIAAPPAVLDGLIASGKVTADSKTILARSAYGVAVRTGTPKPDISSVEAFKRALLNAKSITYLPVPGVPQMIEGLGLKEAIASKVTIPSTDISSELVAKGEIELGIVVITQMFTTPGVELAGPLPPEIQFYATLAARSVRRRGPLMPRGLCLRS
jgi:molybdate transport system substrate-binding protein